MLMSNTSSGGEEKKERLLKPKEVAEMLRLAPSTVNRYLKNGTIKSVELGGTIRVTRRVPQEEIQMILHGLNTNIHMQ